MKLSAVIKWTLILVLLIAVAGGGALCWLWVNADRLIHEAVEDRIAKSAPGWDIRIDRTRLDDASAELHIYNIAIREPGTEKLLANIPELIARIDRDEFVRSQQLIIRAITVRRPMIQIARAANGQWNWQGLPPLQMERKSLPEWNIEGARFNVALDYGVDFPTANFSLNGGNAKLVPSSNSSFDFNGDLNIQNAGHLRMVGDLDFEHGDWKLAGQMNEVLAGDRLVALAEKMSPEVSDRLRTFRRQVEVAATKLRGDSVQLASTEDTALQIQTGIAPALGVAGLLDISFDVVSRGDGIEPKYRVLLGLRNGTINNGVLPFTLHNVDAQLYRDNARTFVHIRNAKNDKTQLDLEASVGTANDGSPTGVIRTNIRNLPLDDRVRRVLPQSIRKVLDPLNAAGTIASLSGTLRAEDGEWIPEGCELQVRDCTSLFDKFRYPVHSISGSMVQRQGTKVFDLDMHGLAGQRPVTMAGFVRNPGPASEVVLTLKADGVPLDETFRAAFDAKGRDVIDKLGITGLASGTVEVYREPVVGFRPVFTVNASVREGRLNYTHFPYELRQLTGNVVYRSKNRSWEYSKLEAFHGETRLTGSGSLDGDRTPNLLHLDLAATDGTLTTDLRAALGSGLRSIWDHLSPTGRFDMDFNIDWLVEKGRPAWVSVPRFRLREGSIKPTSFPYRLNNVNALLNYVPGTADAPDTGRVSITRIVGRHGNTTVDAAGWATHLPNGDWRLHFDRLIGKNVVTNSDLLLAMPEGLRSAFQVLNPTAPFGMENTELEFRGLGDPSVPVTAAWYTETVLNGGAISAGMDLKNVKGRVTNRGSYGPQGLRNEGEVKLVSAEVLDHKLTNVRGPYRIVNDQLWIGAPEVFRQTPQSVPVNKRITADAFGGRITCDARVNLSERSPYQVFVTASDADLRTYANIHMPGERNMSGKMNGWIHLHGAGPDENQIKGKGQLQVSQAAIYEMPVMVNLLQALGTLNFAVADPVAFRYALLNFDVQDRNFIFREIDLVGNAMSLRGRGRVDFDSRVLLDFYSKPPRTAGGIPILSQLVSGATSNWVHVKVDGSLSRPRTRVQPNISLDGAIKPFLQAFDPLARPQMRVPFAGLPRNGPR